MKAEEEPPEKPSNAEPPDPVRVPRIVVRDATIEEMASLLNASPKGLLQLRDELAGWIGKADGLVARLAGVLAFLDWAASREATPPETIHADTVMRANRLWQDYLEPKVRHEWGIAGLSRKDVEEAVWAQLEEEGLVRPVKQVGTGRKGRNYEIIAPEGADEPT